MSEPLTSVDAAANEPEREKPASATTNELNWRLHPQESLSDWTIRVVSSDEEGGSPDVYHVHRVSLAFGCRSSVYFSRLFQQQALAEATTSTSTLEFHPCIAKLFPHLLDYLYSLAKPELSPISTTGLYFLADYLEIRRLRVAILEFWKKDISLETAVVYFEHATVLGVPKVRELLAKLFSQISVIKALAIVETAASNGVTSLLGVADLDFWEEVLANLTLPLDTEQSPHLSLLLVAAAEYNEDDLTLAKLYDLTIALHTIHIDAAYPLLSLEQDLREKHGSNADIAGRVDHKNDTDNVNARGSGDSSASKSARVATNSPELTVLQERCVAALARGFSSMSYDHSQVNFLSRLSPVVLSHIIVEASMIGAL
jgi:BTB/POZ domain